MSRIYRVGILTTGRADFSIYSSVIRALSDHPMLEPGLFVTGMHLSKEFGLTVTHVRDSGFPIICEFPCLISGDRPQDIAASMGLATQGMSEALEKHPIDMLMVLGDRFEMCGAALAAVPYRIPVTHLHGGDETEGAIDNVFRHALTKISHLHCCATRLAERRIVQMGENPDLVHVVGAPALDNLKSVKILDRGELARNFNFPENDPYVLLTYHPVTLEPEATIREFQAICASLDDLNYHAVFTAANADTEGRSLNEKIRNYVAGKTNAMMIDHMGAQGYYSAMEHASLMIGNSSSGILEAASFGLPVVNIGNRQAGRERSANTLDVMGSKSAILNAVELALSPGFLKTCEARENVYGDGSAAPRISSLVADFLVRDYGPKKSFVLNRAES